MDNIRSVESGEEPHGLRSAIKPVRREQLILATIDSISKRGFAGTTMGHVAKTAKLSQGIVNFYFKSKEALLYETLNYLAREHESLLVDTMERAGPDPVAKLNALIEVDLGPKVCNRQKVSVWSSFWAEAPGRPKYLKRCQELNAIYLEQTRILCREIAAMGGYAGVDAERIAWTLNAMIDGFWINAMIDPKDFNRDHAKQACRDLLAEDFPNEFSGPYLRTAVR